MHQEMNLLEREKYSAKAGGTEYFSSTARMLKTLFHMSMCT